MIKRKRHSIYEIVVGFSVGLLGILKFMSIGLYPPWVPWVLIDTRTIDNSSYSDQVS